MKKKFIAIFALILMSVSAYRPAMAQSLLRDAETENFLIEITRPIFLAAGLTPENVRIYLVHDNSINAFVVGGQNIFIHSGLLLEVETVNQLLGVLAHETGHISAGHLRRRDDMARGPANMSIISMVLGAAAIAAGSGDAGIALIAGGQGFAQRTYLKFNRAQESAADQAGARFLDKSGISGRGIIEFFNILRTTENIRGANLDPYIRSHPLNSDRMTALDFGVRNSPYYDTPPNPQWQNRLERIQGKLSGYVKQPKETYSLYPTSDESMEARYARAYAYNKDLEWDLALTEIDKMIEAEPNSAYFYEIKGQILLENHRLDESIIAFRRAVDLAPKEPLILTALGQSLVASENPNNMEEAKDILKLSTALDKENSFGWYNLAIAYTNLEKPYLAALATAERYSVLGNPQFAVLHAENALKGLKEYTPEWLRAQDILYINEVRAKKENKEERKANVKTGFTFQKPQTQ